MITSVVTMRKMTERSTMGFGKFEHNTVEELLNLGQHTYIAYVYYHTSGITFTDEILDKIKIPADKRIEKPGTNPDMFNEYCHRKNQVYVLSGKTVAERARRKNNIRHNEKNRIRHQLVRESGMYARGGAYSKAQLQWTNQGHTGSVYKH